ncbi:MAG: HAD family hydrolase [Flavobacteriales bacterium]|nr:HAD family hydrolase [Flavobacteriales bacterium]
MKNKALFLDRDGVINHDPGDYTYSLKEFVVLPGVIDALELAVSKGYLLIIITNQGGIAKGLYSDAVVREIHEYLGHLCRARNFAITAIYYSPHHPDFGNSLTRKPCSLMIERALARYHIDPKRSLMVGDKMRDLEAAEKAGVPGILIPTNGSLLDVVNRLD